MKRLIYTITAAILFFTFLLSGCSFSSSTEPVTASAFCFDTVITIKIWDTGSQKLLNGCIQKCEEYEQKFSRTLEGSEIYQINHAGGEPVTVSEDTAELIRIGLYYSELSDGKFDITIAPLSILWDFKNNTGTVPDESAILEACSHVNYENVKLSGNTVVLTDPKAGIDLGGIAKGYIADELKSYLTDSGVQHATISLGGNVETIG